MRCLINKEPSSADLNIGVVSIVKSTARPSLKEPCAAPARLQPNLKVRPLPAAAVRKKSFSGSKGHRGAHSAWLTGLNHEQPASSFNNCSYVGSQHYQHELEPQNESLHVAGEIALFRAVIMQALLDSVSQSKRTEDKVAKSQARDWFDENNPDFVATCQLAQLNHRWVLKQSIAAISNGCKRDGGK